MFENDRRAVETSFAFARIFYGGVALFRQIIPYSRLKLDFYTLSQTKLSEDLHFTEAHTRIAYIWE